MQRHFKYGRNLKRERRFSAKLGLTVAIVLLSCSAVCFFYLPSISSHFPSSSNLPASQEQVGLSGSNTTCDGKSDHIGPSCNEELQEIVEVTDQGDTISSLMSDNISDDAVAQKVAVRLAAIIRQHRAKPFDSNTALDPGCRYTINLDREGRFLKAAIELDAANVFHIMQDASALRSWKEEVVLDFKLETLVFQMRGTLDDSVSRAGEGTELASKIRHLFKWDIDFQSEAFRGDTCKVLFERRYADDRPSGYGRILCAVYEGKKTTKTAILFGDKYYNEKLEELKKDFLRTPLKKIRVTSHFGNRFHPVLRVWRKHMGVDYGAAEGTPVWSVASGVVTFAGRQNGYGNYVCVRHDNGFESRYGHLQRFEKDIRMGRRVKQGDQIGRVGMTGIATGPHLDFQLLEKGKHVNPLYVKMVQSLKTVPEPLAPRFASVLNDRLLSLNVNRVVLVNSTSRSRKSVVE